MTAQPAIPLKLPVDDPTPGPIAVCPPLPLVRGDWLVSSYALAQTVLRADGRTFEQGPLLQAAGVFEHPETVMILAPRDAHRDRRTEVQGPHFSRGHIEGYAAGVVHREAQAAVERLRAAGEAELQDVALEYAWRVGSTVVGIDGLTADGVRRHLEQLRPAPGRNEVDREAARRVFNSLMADLEPSLERRRRQPQGDIFSTIAASGRDMALLKEEAVMWLLAAFLTTSGAIPRVDYLLDLHHPYRTPEREGLLAAFDETLRLMPLLPLLSRRATHDQILGGVPVRAGEVVVIDVRVANRDPAAFGEDASQFVPGRPSAGKALKPGLSFGAGPRTCLGEQLAREEAAALLGALYRAGMEHAGPWELARTPFPAFLTSPVRLG